MTAWANIAGTWRKGLMWQNVGGTWRKLTPWHNLAGVWKEDPDPTPTPLAATASPASVTGAASRPAGALVQTNETTVSVNGGAAPLTYSWASQDGTMTPTAPSSAATRFSAFVEGGESASDTFVCTVTDAGGQMTTATVLATVYNYGKQTNATV